MIVSAYLHLISIKAQRPESYKRTMEETKKENITMTRGSKEKYSAKQKRQARHIEDSVEHRGGSKKEAQRIAWATVNKETGGAGKSVTNTKPSQKGGKVASHRISHATRVAAGKKAAGTRKQRQLHVMH